MSSTHFLSLADQSAEELRNFLDLARHIKLYPKAYKEACKGMTLAMIFQKPSLRTRVSFQTGIYQLGGQGIYLGPTDIQLHRGETIADTAKVLSRYVDGIMARVFAHSDVVELGRYGSIPVINGLSDLLHPCQVLADLQTVLEKKGTLKGLTLAYVGDGNNMAHSIMYGCALMGVNVAIGHPRGYAPDAEVTTHARELAAASGASVLITEDPQTAVAGADAVYTDVWASMGQEGEHSERLARFKGFQVNNDLMALANPDAIFLHCLPAHRGEEVAAEVIDGPQSVVFDQAENRLHAQKAIMVRLMGRGR
ncbi:MAG: ornithine carbamoyltransferase [Myxococcota bacterium]|jgi:ornithine carbamoyltransferase